MTTRKPRKALLLALCLACPAAALAGPGKAGLWEVRTSLENFGVGGYRIAPEQLEQMRQFGLEVPGLSQPFVARQCLTPEQAARDELPRPQTGDSGCELRDVQHNGNVWNAGIACSGSLRGKGRITARFENNERFSGTWAFRGTSDQVPTEIETSNPYSGRWLGPNCGRVQPARR